MPQARNRAPLIAAILAVAVALAAADVFALVVVIMNLTGAGLDLTTPGIVPRLIDALRYAHLRAPVYVWFFAFGPLLAGLAVALLVGLRRDAAVEPAAEPAAPPPSPVSALRLLALLQQEGRLIDFLEEDIGSYGDAQVGAAVRAIHSGCRNALHERMKIERIYEEEDGAAIEVGPGFDPAAVRLTGNVHGKPPFRGTLQHGGWRASQVSLPVIADLDPTILAPAEVELA
jgi:hypothetical protein